KQKGDVRLDQLDFDVVKGTSTETWHDTLNKLNLGEMPRCSPVTSADTPSPKACWLIDSFCFIYVSRLNIRL
ncbi:MAG: hypothetical protein OSA89_20270, partial [Mariniblastus sp.]|nr:hypothetical protein [Mariniblastus sp.]